MMNTQSQLVATTIATLLFAGVITTSVIGGNEAGKLETSAVAML